MLLRSFRLAAGLSQEGLAERAGMSAHGIRALERGYRRTPQRATLALLASALALDDEQRRELEAAAARWVLLRDGGAPVTVGPWVGAAPSNLPLSLASFVGRERELEEIAALLREHRLVTLTGSGGVGKTQMALRVATVPNDTANDGVWFVALAPVGDPSFVAAAIASSLGVQEVSNRPLLGTLLAYLRNKSPLLVLDNCEHLITQAATVVHALLAGCPDLRILATSRAPLRSAGERSYRLPPLSFPSPEAATQLRATDATTYGAIALFSDRARAVDHRFTLTDENACDVAALCGHLDGIPLAIELAAARVNSLSITALTTRLEDRFRVLAGGERTALPRQQTMRATIDWSYDSLSAGEQRLFERLSVFAGGCTLASAEAVCAGEELATADIVNLNSSLVDKSMVTADLDGSEPRYWLLESFRQYAAEKLATRGERQRVAGRHAVACLVLAEQLERAYDAEPDGVWLDLGRNEVDNWRAAMRWSLTARGNVVLGQRLVGGLRVLWEYFTPLEGRRWLEAACRLIDEQTPTDVRASLSLAEATVAWHLRDYETQLKSAQNAIALYRTLDDALGVARAQSLAGYALASLDRFAEAKLLQEEALTAARRLDNRRLAAYILRCCGYFASLDGDIISARSCVAEALHIYEAMGTERARGVAMADLSMCEFLAGNPQLALQHVEEGLALVRRCKEMNSFDVVLLSSMSGYLIALARYDEAWVRAREALILARDYQRDVYAVWALQRLAAIAVLRPRAESLRASSPYARAARILGFIDARLATTGSAVVLWQQQEHDRVLNIVREAMGADTTAKLMAVGAAMTEDQAVEEALSAAEERFVHA
ncbi:MAG: helix-turn-helix domain-containing protein [Candidatus Cybelea sp.]